MSIVFLKIVIGRVGIAPLSTLYVLLTAAPPWHLSLCSARCLRQNRGIAWDSPPSVQSEEWQKNNPGTPVSAIKAVLRQVDQVLVMTVNPGFGGQAFIPETLDKGKQSKEICLA